MYPSKSDPYFGVFIKNIENGLIENNVAVERIVIYGQGQTFFEKLKKYLSFYYQILRADFSKYDFVHCSYPSHTILPFLFKRKRSYKLIVRFHGLEIVSDKPNDRLLRIRRGLSKLAIKLADLVVVPSEYFREKVSELGSLPRVFKYPSGGVNRRLFFPGDILPQRGTLHIGIVGRVDVGKGVDKLIQACAKLDFDYKLTIVGKGSLLAQMKQLCADLKVSATFIGAVPQDELPHYYRSFDVLVFPTERSGESFGNVGIESMACGTPVIGSNFAGLKEYLVHGKNGFFFEVGDVLSLASALRKYHDLPHERRISLSQGALDTAAQFDRQELSKRFVQYLKELLNA